MADLEAPSTAREERRPLHFDFLKSEAIALGALPVAAYYFSYLHEFGVARRLRLPFSIFQVTLGTIFETGLLTFVAAGALAYLYPLLSISPRFRARLFWVNLSGFVFLAFPLLVLMPWRRWFLPLGFFCLGIVAATLMEKQREKQEQDRKKSAKERQELRDEKIAQLSSMLREEESLANADFEQQKSLRKSIANIEELSRRAESLSAEREKRWSFLYVMMSSLMLTVSISLAVHAWGFERAGNDREMFTAKIEERKFALLRAYGETAIAVEVDAAGQLTRNFRMVETNAIPLWRPETVYPPPEDDLFPTSQPVSQHP
jgi:hypothetical protein